MGLASQDSGITQTSPPGRGRPKQSSLIQNHLPESIVHCSPWPCHSCDLSVPRTGPHPAEHVCPLCVPSTWAGAGTQQALGEPLPSEEASSFRTSSEGGPTLYLLFNVESVPVLWAVESEGLCHTHHWSFHWLRVGLGDRDEPHTCGCCLWAPTGDGQLTSEQQYEHSTVRARGETHGTHGAQGV